MDQVAGESLGPMINTSVIRRDEKLLKKEAYIRRERYVCLGLIPILLFGMWCTNPPHEEVGYGLNVIVFLACYAYFCTLRIRHIESIKAYRAHTQ
jgi:hypothetical protein